MKTVLQWVIFITLFLLGFALFLLLICEDDPNAPLPLWQFFLEKAGAMLGIYLCWWMGKVAHKHGLYPEAYAELYEEEIKNEEA